MSIKTVSIAVAYLLLLVAVFVAEAFLTTVFISSVYKTTSSVPEIASRITAGLVYGTYDVGPYYKEVNDPRFGESYIVYTWALYITIVNPNPSPTEVVLVSHIPSLKATRKVVDMLSTFGIEWLNKTSGVDRIIGSPKWFPEAYSYLYMPPHSVASFRMPLYTQESGGYSETILACTPVGCTTLDYAGVGVIPRVPTQTWIITNSTRLPQQGGIARPQNWPYHAYSIAGPVYMCGKIMQQPITITIPACGLSSKCCYDCPSGCYEMWKESDRGACKPVDGTTQAYDLDLPMNVIAAYYSAGEWYGAADSYDFKIPSQTIKVGGLNYKLYGFERSGRDASFSAEWLKYDGVTCIDRVITMNISITPSCMETNNVFSCVWSKSSSIFVYVAAKGYYGPPDVLFSKMTDKITVKVLYKRGGVTNNLGSVTSSDTSIVDNSRDLSTDPRRWAVPVDASEIIISVTIELSGPPDRSLIPCFFQGLFGLLSNCGSGTGSERGLRVGFYVELIPSEYLS